eukprot:262578-Amphidinium_carterae.2
MVGGCIMNGCRKATGQQLKRSLCSLRSAKSGGNVVVAGAAQKRCPWHTSSSASPTRVQQSQMLRSGLYRSRWFGIQSTRGTLGGWGILETPMAISAIIPNSATPWKGR